MQVSAIEQKIIDEFGFVFFLRVKKLLIDAIKKFELNLCGFNILTEAASGYFILTPIIAAIAGARKVYAITKDSQYASAEEVKKNTHLLAGYFGVKDKIEILTSLEKKIVKKIDIITNLGFVRPITKQFIDNLKPTAVIPLMWEPWEYRETDLDLKACFKRDILVLGTNEHNAQLQIFGYLGLVTIKLLFEMGIEVFKSNLLVVGTGDFGSIITKCLKKNGANAYWVTAHKSNYPALANLIVGTSLKDRKVKKILKNTDAIVFAEHNSKELLLGKNGQISGSILFKLNPSICIVHIAGNIQQSDLVKNCIQFIPSTIAEAGKMSVTTDYVGPKPLIDLHTAGLKIGEEMAHARKKGLSTEEARRKVLKNSLAKDFSLEQKKKYKII